MTFKTNAQAATSAILLSGPTTILITASACLSLCLVGLYLGSLMKSPSPIVLPTHGTEHTGCRARKSSHTCYAHGGALTAPPSAGNKQNMAAVNQSIGGSVPREPRSSKHAMVSAAPYYTEGNRGSSFSSPPPPPARAKYHKYQAFVSQV